MKCAWQEFLQIVPVEIRSQVDQIGKESLQELRLRVGQKAELVCSDKSILLNQQITDSALQYTINAASRYSPWSAATTSEGYISCPGGHRLGICGSAVVKDGSMTGIVHPSSLCLRVAREFPGIAGSAKPPGSILIIGKPGSGKTTLLRDLIRCRSLLGNGSVAVVDERGELFPVVNGVSCFESGPRTDIVTGCKKRHGLPLVIKTMNPACIAVDEITAPEDAQAILQAAWCGVDLYATAHAGSRSELYRRPVYRTLLEAQIFQTLLVLSQDKSWKTERLCS